MSAPTVAPGCIFHWTEHTFSDGTKANKYFIILGAKQGSNYLAVICTSKQKKKQFVAGCHHKDGYYHIPGGGKDWFPKDTWVLLEPQELSSAEFLKRAIDNEITLCGNLRTDIANAIRNCFKQCADVSEYHVSLL